MADQGGDTVVAAPVDPFADWRALQLGDAAVLGRTAAHALHAVVGGRASGPGRLPVPELSPTPVPQLHPDVDVAGSVAVLDHPRLVVTEGYIGPERRRPGVGARVGRSTWAGRRRLLRLDLLIVLAMATMGLGALLLTGGGDTATPTATPAHGSRTAVPARSTGPASAAGVAGPRTRSGRSVTAPPAVPPASTAPATGPAAAPPAAAPPAATPATVPSSAAAASTDAQAGATPGTPEALGAAALTLVRYPWRQLPGYSIVFRPIADAPSPGFYGNTTFTWGSPGGVSTLYVYPGESVEQLAGITAFEIAHEVDAAYVEPRGGHDAISSLLGIRPASWAPQCDCAEQGYLSGWYAAAFSAYWSPGVGAWSSLAPLPSGPTLVALEPWLDPSVP